jgi:hypothetical protein
MCLNNLISLNSDDNDTVARKFINRRRCIKPVYYNDPVHCLLSYEIEPLYKDPCDLLTSSTSDNNEIFLLQKTIGLLEKKLHEAAFNEQEKRVIQSIVIDDDAVEMQILFPKPIMEIKDELNEITSSAALPSKTSTTIDMDHITNGQIPFQINVSVFQIVPHSMQFFLSE